MSRSVSRRVVLRGSIGVVVAGCSSGGPPGTPPPGGCVEPSPGSDPGYCLADALVVRVAGAASLAEGEAVLVAPDDANAVIVARDARGLYARSGICTHACCVVSLCGDVACSSLSTTPPPCESTGPRKGDPQGANVVCPCHGSRFRLSDGVALSGPAATPLPAYAIVLDGSDALVDTGDEVDTEART